jgi:endogenous inhibitor of DNA gyrase (YacG/DUF329 family)
MINKYCHTCQKSISVRYDRVRERNFCSKKCTGKARDKRVLVACIQCSVIVLKHAFKIKDGTRIFCGRECLNKYQVGKNNPKWVKRYKL